MNPGYNAEQIARRKDQVAATLRAGGGFGCLAMTWNITIVAARDWCLRYIAPDDCTQLAENGRLSVHRASASVADRLALVKLCRGAGWTDAQIARAVGISRSGLSQWLSRNAPDGLDSAIEDFSEDGITFADVQADHEAELEMHRALRSRGTAAEAA